MHRRYILTAWAVSALVLSLGCSTPEETDEPPTREDFTLPGCIEVDQTSIDLGEVDVMVPGSRTTGVLTVRNACKGVLELGRPRIEGGAAALFDVGQLGKVALGSDEQTVLDLSFAPLSAEPHLAVLILPSNDAAKPEILITLTGRGLGPRIALTPESTDHGAPYIGCEQSQFHSVANLGTEPLIVSQAELLTESPDSFSLDLDPLTNGELPFTIEPSEEVTLYLDYLPLDVEPDSAFFAVESNDPARSRAVASAVGTGTAFGTGSDTFKEPLYLKTDVLMTMDRSSGLDTLAGLTENTDSLVRTLSAMEVDYRAAIVVGDDGCVVGSEPYIDASFSRSEAVESFQQMADLDRHLSPYGSNEERGFTIAKAALSTDNLAVGGCNASFYRDDAFLSIVHVSDEPEQSLSETWSSYIAWVQALKASPEQVRIHAIAGDYPSGCASAAPGTGYYEATVATGGAFLSWCATDFGKTMETLAEATMPTAHAGYRLSSQPVPQSIQVRVDGVLVSTGWQYDISSNTVVFDEGSEPPPGSTIEIVYDRLPDCEH